jgi:hypothetical protein
MGRSTLTADNNSSRRFTSFAGGVALLLGAAAFWGANKEILGLFHDDGVYAVVAKAIAQGEGYRIISLPSAPPQTKYPFLYSYLLSWLWFLNPSFPHNILLLKAFNIAALVAIFLGAVALYRRIFPAAKTSAVVFAVLVCTNPIIFTYTDYVVSDLLYVLLALTALLISRARAGAGAGASMSEASLLTVITGLACLTRLAAAPLVFAGAVKLFLSRRWRSAIYFVGGIMLLVAPWFFWVWSNPASSMMPLLSYYGRYDFAGPSVKTTGHWIAGYLPVVTGNARYLLASFDLIYLLPLMPWLSPFVVGLTVVGMFVSLRREDVFAWAFLLATTVLLLIWPFHPGRYIAPLLPLLILFFFRGMAAAERWIESAAGKVRLNPLVAKFAWAPAALVLLLNGVWLSSYLLIKDVQTTRGLYGSRLPYGWNGFEESFSWIRHNTAADARLGTAYDPMYFLYTGRQSIRPVLHRAASYFYPYGQAKPDVGSVDDIKTHLQTLRIDYLIIDPLDGYAEGEATIKLLDNLVASYGDQAKIVFTSADGKHRIYALANE